MTLSLVCKGQLTFFLLKHILHVMKMQQLMDLLRLLNEQSIFELFKKNCLKR
jgi:hypothetical protein